MATHLYARGAKLWCRLKNEDGHWVSKPTPYRVGQDAEAARYVKRAQEKFDQRRSGEISAPKTVRAFAAKWIIEREKLDLDWNADESRLRHHVLPVIGDMLIADVRAHHIVALFHEIRTSKGLAPRTVHNIYSSIAAMFRDAKLLNQVEQTPCELTSRQLGDVTDKDSEWRGGAVFARDEVETIISDLRIPPDRHIVYGLELLAGVRPGEAAALRWRHYDPAITPLGQLLVAHAYSTRKNRQKGTKTKSVKYVPVHPTLAEMLAEWRATGWAAMHGREPTPDDLIVPLPPAAIAARRTRTGEPFRGYDYSGKRWREEDLPALGWRQRRHYDMRATFITLALEDGADPLVIETRVTHTKKTRSAFTGYNRGLQWEATCREVAKLRIARRSVATVLATLIESSSENVVEAVGVERTSSPTTIRQSPPSSSNEPVSQIRPDVSPTRAVAGLATGALARAVYDFVAPFTKAASYQVVGELEARAAGRRS